MNSHALSETYFLSDVKYVIFNIIKKIELNI